MVTSALRPIGLLATCGRSLSSLSHFKMYSSGGDFMAALRKISAICWQQDKPLLLASSINSSSSLVL